MEFLSMNIFEKLELLFLIFLRMIGFFTTAPFFSGRNIPVYVKIILGFMISTMVISTQTVTSVVYNNNALVYLSFAIVEIMVGIIVGFFASIAMQIIVVAGHIMDMQIGFSMINTLDPLSEGQMPITGNLYYFLLTMMLLTTNMHHLLIKSIFYTYKIIPIGHFVFGTKTMPTLISMMGDLFVFGFKFASPIIGVAFIIDVSMGILSKTVPHINIFAVGSPIKLMACVIILVIITPSIILGFQQIFDIMQQNTFTAIKNLVYR